MVDDMRPYVCVTTRDGRPSFDVLRAVNSACARVPGSRMGHTKCGHSVAVARNMAVAIVLGGNFSHLMFVDNDTLVPADALEKLLSLDVDVASGCTATTTEEKAHLNVARRRGDPLPLWYRHWFRGVREVPVVGASCLLIRRGVFERVGFPWFRFRESWDGRHYQMVSEDIDFCDRVIEAGMKILADGDVRCGHRREVDVSEWIMEEQDIWGSHLPVLTKIGRCLDVRRVIEYGGGIYSTPHFLNRDVFPLLEELVSVEEDSYWFERIKSSFPDPRLKVSGRLVNGKPDLAFIDSGDGDQSYRYRRALLKAYEPSSTIVVLHDAHEDVLRRACEESSYQHKLYFGQTAVLSNNPKVRELENVSGDDPGELRNFQEGERGAPHGRELGSLEPAC